MKHVIALAILVGVLAISTGCGSMPAVAEPTDYQSLEYVRDVKGLKAPAIYDGVKLWIAENFRSAKQVIDLDDRERGILIGNGVLPNVILDSGIVQMPLQASFKMKVEVKDEKMRLTFSQFEIVGRANSTLFKSEAVQIRSRLAAFGDQIVRHLESRKISDF